MVNMRFNDVVLDQYLTVENIERPFISEVVVHTRKIPDRTGEQFRRVEKGMSKVDVTVRIEGATRLEVGEKAHVLRSILYTTEPKRLELRDEPSYYQMAILSGTVALERLFQYGRATLTFLIPEGVYIHKTLTNVPLVSNAPIAYRGNAPTPFVIEGTSASTAPVVITNAATGRKITLDSKTANVAYRIDTFYQSVTLNGQLAQDVVSFDTDFWDLTPFGTDNRIVYTGLKNAKIIYRERMNA